MCHYLTGQLPISQDTSNPSFQHLSLIMTNGCLNCRYPLEDYVRENEAEDKRCLAQVEDIFESQKKKGSPISGMIVEPIQSEGGDHHGSKEWFQVSVLLSYSQEWLDLQNLSFFNLGSAKDLCQEWCNLLDWRSSDWRWTNRQNVGSRIFWFARISRSFYISSQV